MPMLNVGLYNALVRLAASRGLGEVSVVNEGEQCRYTLPQVPEVSFRKHKEETLDANVDNSGWGECYNLNCPGCGDTRHRLFVCHMWNQHFLLKKRVIRFSKRLYVCHNEHCRLNDFLAELVINPADQRALKPERAKVDLDAVVPLPAPLFSLTNELTPMSVHIFLASRGFEPLDLERDWRVGFVPKGAVYPSGDKQEEFREDRLFIPVFSRRRLMYWQARALVDASWQKKKYLNQKNTNGIGKASLLYNMDRAWKYPRVTIVEGVTDVWRIGFDAVSIFGTHISEEQLRLMKVLWGHAGQACICLDEDAYDKAREQARRLEQEKVFPGGVVVVKLDKGRDPADYDTEEIRHKLDLAFATLDQRGIAREQAQAFLDNDERPDLYEPVTKEGFN